MAKGKAKVNYLGRSGVVMPQTVPSWDFIYDVSNIISEKYFPGDRVILPDGREFTYAKSTGSNVLFAAHGCVFTYTGYTAFTSFAVSQSVGDREVTVPAATHAALTQDELRGGYIILFDGADDSNTTVRGIIGNDSADANALFKVYLDAKITSAIVAGTEACEVYRNPYAALDVASSNESPKAGVPAARVSASAQYFWVQSSGITWVAPQSGVGGTEGQTGVFWRHDGSLDKADTALATTVPSTSSSQYAGYLVAGSQAGNGPLLKLTG